MKTLKFYSALILGVMLISCSSDDKTVDQVVKDTTHGAILRTIAVPSATFDFFDTASVWEVELEEQDAEDGALFQEIQIFVSYSNSTTGETDPEVPLKTIPASQFSPGPYGLPRGTVSASLSEVLAATGLTPGDYISSDQFLIRLVVVLTDGRMFSSEASGNVTGGSFFSSPYAYSVQFFCPLADVSLFDGNYVVVTDIWEDYSPGDIVPVEPDPADPFTFRILSTNNAFISNPGTSYMLVTVDPSDGSATVSSNECFDYGPGFCLDITGSGSVGTCTGDINIVIDFGGFTNNAFSLVKQ